MLKDYYEGYWERRSSQTTIPPIRQFVPAFLRKYSTYGAILNCLPDRGKFLDVGCGDGNVSQLYLNKGEVFGIDISKGALKLAREKGIETKWCDLNKGALPFEDNSFDAVIFTDVIEHLVNPFAIIKEAKKVLKKGGRIIITVPNFARLNNRLKMLLGDPTDLLHWAKYGDEVEHLHWFTKPKLQYLLESVDFKNISFVPTGLPWGFILGSTSLPGLSNFLTVVSEK